MAQQCKSGYRGVRNGRRKTMQWLTRGSSAGGACGWVGSVGGRVFLGGLV